MGQFKPMVKMETTEPSVELKLAKGGAVKMKNGGSTTKAKKMAMGGGAMDMMAGTPALVGRPAVNAPVRAPGKPSMASRRKSMMAKPAMAKPAMPMGNPSMPAPMKKGGKAEGGESKAAHKAEMSAIKGVDKKLTKHASKAASKGHKGLKTGGVALGNGGGYKTGGVTDGQGGYKTGGVALGNGGGFKHGGKTSKKAYATGGTVDSGKPVAMPKKPMSRPVANSMQSGTFAKGGKVNFYSDLAKKLEKNPEKPNLRLIKTHTGPKGHVAKVYKDRDYGEYRTKFYSPEGKHLTEGDSHTDDSEDAHMTAKHEVNKGYAKGGKAKKYADGSRVTPAGDPKVVTDKASRELEDALNPLGMIKEGAQKVRDYFTSKPAPAGSVTKTEKSVTVAPRKRGGSAMC